MFDQSFNETSLSREIRKSDFRKYRALHNDSERQKQITDACTRGKDGFPDLSAFTISTIRGKCVVKVPKFSDELTLRKINANILKLANIRMMDRDSIVANIEALLSEGIQYRIYRLDIKSFYESISLADISSRIESIKLLSSPTKRHILDILRCFQRSGQNGIPRGLSVSATLSELILSDFDKKVSSHAEVFYFSRYVDDIILITSGDENRRKFTKLIKSWLPTGLTLNSKKQVIKERSRVYNEKGAAIQAINTKEPAIDFEFLGYKFKVKEQTSNDGKKPRIVDLDIADTKVNKIKTRIIKSLLSYASDKDFELLEDRISFLCSNFSVIDSDRDRKRLAGIYHNYHRISHEKSEALSELDLFLKKVITSGHGRACHLFFCNTNDTQRRNLLQWSFRRGHEKKIYLHFSEKRLSEIQRCWKYV
ncbi:MULTISPECIES: antiviral reverse transcriptase Drt3a [Pseudomonas]|jgi:hypothetical protein|uniref:antiviral reverse transcriptase Drt3a n=1 Tax=Pseudomonas TaxID=286 RepID=UPI002E811C31|nr:antiviral reverse transcriptase Drt3a [Pseudomonas sp. AM8]